MLSMRGELSKSGGLRLTSGARRHQRDAVKAELQQLPAVPTKRPDVPKAQHTEQPAVPSRKRAAEEPLAA